MSTIPSVPPSEVRRDYWKDRKNLGYYKQVEAYADQYCPTGRSLLDVGGGVSMGCKLLERFARFDRRMSVENWANAGLPEDESSIDGVEVEICDFLKWQYPVEKFDLVLCLQVLEHIEDEKIISFTQRLFACGEVVIISVPYRWEAGRCEYHCQDPVDEDKLFGWTGSEPGESVIVGERLVAVYG